MQQHNNKENNVRQVTKKAATVDLEQYWGPGFEVGVKVSQSDIGIQKEERGSQERAGS